MKRKVVEYKYYLSPNDIIPYRIGSKSERAAVEAIRKETQEMNTNREIKGKGKEGADGFKCST